MLPRHAVHLRRPAGTGGGRGLPLQHQPEGPVLPELLQPRAGPRPAGGQWDAQAGRGGIPDGLCILPPVLQGGLGSSQRLVRGQQGVCALAVRISGGDDGQQGGGGESRQWRRGRESDERLKGRGVPFVRTDEWRGRRVKLKKKKKIYIYNEVECLWRLSALAPNRPVCGRYALRSDFPCLVFFLTFFFFFPPLSLSPMDWFLLPLLVVLVLYAQIVQQQFSLHLSWCGQVCSINNVLI